MITCVVDYVIDASKVDAFERFARRWMELVSLHGGTHHGYFLPASRISTMEHALAPPARSANRVRVLILDSRF